MRNGVRSAEALQRRNRRNMEIFVNYDYREEDVCNLLDVEDLARFVIESEEMPASSEVSITFVDDEAIHELNREWRGIDRPTDVLSFECDGVDDEMAGSLAEDMAFELGDIVIAVDVAQRQAPEYGMSFSDEVSLLITHGLLHLCGYDHLEPAEAEEMEARERELLSAYYGRPFKRFAHDLAPATDGCGQGEIGTDVESSGNGSR